VELTLVRNTTLLIDLAGRRLLLDPMLDPAGARPPVPQTPNPRPNPTVGLPLAPEHVVAGLDAVLVTHLHQDHLDAAEVRLLPKDLPVLCQPGDQAALAGHGFADVRPVEGALELDGLRVARTGGRHGRDELAEALGPVSGFVLTGSGEPTLYVAGDTVWCPDVEEAIAEHHPDVIVVNACGARFLVGEPIVMDADDVVALARAAPEAIVVAVHLEAISHCLVTRAELRERLDAEGLAEAVLLPADGEAMSFR
jgi:L-ascorbate metabolism protein UlaG (beta-lactamase superfamily)